MAGTLVPWAAASAQSQSGHTTEGATSRPGASGPDALRGPPRLPGRRLLGAGRGVDLPQRPAHKEDNLLLGLHYDWGHLFCLAMGGGSPKASV